MSSARDVGEMQSVTTRIAGKAIRIEGSKSMKDAIAPLHKPL
jgi:hypothetical protein